jgi:hypothetical protein
LQQKKPGCFQPGKSKVIQKVMLKLELHTETDITVVSGSIFIAIDILFISFEDVIGK